MDRLAKSIRMSCGLVLLANLIGWFLPWVHITQENYPTLSASQIQYIYALFFGKALPMTTSGSFSSTQILLVIFGMIIPAAVVLFCGIWGIVGDPKQILTGIGTIINGILQIVMFANRDAMWSLSDNQKVTMQSGSVILLLGAAVTTILGICTFFIRPRVQRTTESEIPQLQEIKEEKLQAQYNIIQEEAKQEQGQIFPDDSNVAPKITEPRGVIVGIYGMYEGAEIPLKDGETIRFGRSSENDLVFSGQTHVSRQHCRITWKDASKNYVIFDTSSAGSYIDGREDPIPQNMEVILETGTILDIGDISNRFRLD